MEDKNKPGLAARALAAVKRFAGGERPETLKGLKGVWLMASCAGVVCVLPTLVMGLCGEAGWAGIFAGCAVALLLVFASMAAYVIARSPKKIFRRMYSVFMVGLIVPFQIAIIPLYKIVSGLHLMNTLPGVVLIDVFCINLPLSIFLFRGFINTVPKELEEAAYMDGCGVLRTFWQIIFPLLKPIVSTVAILDALAVWNDFMTPLLFLQSPQKGVMLQEVYKNVGPFSTNWTSFFPMLVLATLPLVVFYLIMQKSIIEGVVAGSVKG